MLLLGGTGEARRLAAALATDPAIRVVSSLAGRVANPTLPAGEVRVGGFGGPDGLAAWLRDERVGAVVDATHPFAARISASAAQATAKIPVPFLVLSRPGWTAQPGDDWHRVPSLAAAAETVATLGERVFLSTGRQGLAAFAHLRRQWFLVRSVDPPDRPAPHRRHVILHRGPFTVDGEVALLRQYAIETVVTKDSGGELTSAKLVAARRLGLPVVMIDRPPAGAAAASSNLSTVDTVEAAVAWVAALAHGG